MSPDDLRLRARRLIEEVFNQGDLAVASELMSPTCIHHVPGAELTPGPASLRDWLSCTHRIFPDFHAIAEDEFATGDQVAQRITAYGTHAATGRPVEFSVLQIARAGLRRPVRRVLVLGRPGRLAPLACRTADPLRRTVVASSADQEKRG